MLPCKAAKCTVINAVFLNRSRNTTNKIFYSRSFNSILCSQQINQPDVGSWVGTVVMFFYMSEVPQVLFVAKV